MSWLDDLRFALRALTRNPGFSLASILFLALALGTSTAVFTFGYHVEYRPLAVPDVGRLMTVGIGTAGTNTFVPTGTFADWQKHSRAFVRLAAFRGGPWRTTLEGLGEDERFGVYRVGPGFFALAGPQMAAGRSLDERDCTPEGEGVVVMSHPLSVRLFGSAEAAVGRVIKVEGQDRRVVGVAKRSLLFPYRSDLWVPLVLAPDAASDRVGPALLVFGRLAQGFTAESAQQELTALERRLAEERGETSATGTVVVARTFESFAGYSPATAAFLGLGSLFLMLMSGANIATVVLARAVSQRKEIAVRTAIGASRFAAVRRLVIESLLRSLLAAALGLPIAAGIMAATLILCPVLAGAGGFGNAQIGGVAIGFSVTVATTLGLGFGLGPALSLGRVDIHRVLKESDRRTPAVPRARDLRAALVVLQVALALVLCWSGLLFLNDYRRSLADKGFDTHDVALAQVTALRDAQEITSTEQVNALLGSIRALPLVTRAAFVAPILLRGSDAANASLSVAGRDDQDPPAEDEDEADTEKRPRVWRRIVSEDFFATVGMTLLQGRGLAPSDTAASRPVALVSVAFANQHLAGVQQALGRRIRVASDSDERPVWRQVVGIVSDTQVVPGQGPEPAVYVSFRQHTPDQISYFLARSAQAQDLLRPLREVLAAAIPRKAITQVVLFDQQLAEAMFVHRFVLALLGTFAVLALAVATFGLFGSTAFLVAERTSELGIRMALGAAPADVFRLLLGRAGRLGALGLAVGFVLMLTAGLTLDIFADQSLARQAGAALAATLLVLVVALLGACWPAWRASALTPLAAISDRRR